MVTLSSQLSSLGEDPLSRTDFPTVHAYHPGVRAAWDEFVTSAPSGSPFHLIAWKNVLERTFHYEARYFYAARAGKITGVAPVFLISNWIMGKCLISIPLAVYGGIAAADKESEDALLNQLKQLAVAERVEHLELRNRSGEALSDFHHNPLYVTFTAPLAKNPDDNLKRLPKDTRYMIRKAQKAGLEARWGADQLEPFYHLFAQNMQKHGTPLFPRSLLESIIDEFGGSTDLALVYSNGKPVAGTLSFLFRGVVLPYYAGAGPEAPRLAANNFLYAKVMEKASLAGFREFDFGRSKKGTGSYAFKTQWNMNVEPLNYQIFLVKRREVPNFSPLNPKFQLATRLWQKVPLWLTRQIGPRVVRWFP